MIDVELMIHNTGIKKQKTSAVGIEIKAEAQKQLLVDNFLNSFHQGDGGR